MRGNKVLGMSKIHDILRRKGTEVVTVSATASVLDAARVMNENHIGALVVTEGEHIVGIVTERDVMNRVVTAQRDPGETVVGEVMTTPIAVCSPETSAAECRKTMRNRRIRHLPVVVDDHLVGMISIGDIIEDNNHEQEQTIRYLYDYMSAR